MAFFGPNDFLILEKSGAVKRVTDGVVVENPLLQIDVSEKDERGLLGIAVRGKTWIIMILLQNSNISQKRKYIS